jgi:hypothetical protein
MPIFSREGRNLLFVHVPKTGGSTIERIFKRSGWTTYFLETRTTGGDLFPLRRCSPQHYQAELLRELLNVSSLAGGFMIVRDPVARFRSEYLMRNTKDPRTDAASVEAWADRAFTRYRTNPYIFDNHLRPQHEFLLEGVTVHRLENGMESVMTDLNSRLQLDLDPKIPHAMHSSKRAGVSSSAVELSPSLLERLTEFYARDYEELGYPLPGTSA